MSEIVDQTADADSNNLEGLEPQWYALHVLSGLEKRVKESMEKRIKTEEISDLIFEVIVPVERVSEVKRGKKVETERKLYPGYVFVKMFLHDVDKKFVGRSWYFIQETHGVIGFADGDRPSPMRPHEIEAMLWQMRDREERVVPRIAFNIGDKVKVGDGPFQSSEGVIDEIDAERGKLKVSVSIFGRFTPVELEFWQVEKAT